MVFVWNGLGFMVPVIGFGSLITAQFCVNSVMGDSRYYSVVGWPKLAGFALAALLTFGFDEWLRMRFEDEANQQGIEADATKRPDHSFFFIPMRYWPLLFLGIGFLAMFIPAKS